jgi:hypothetical protein
VSEEKRGKREGREEDGCLEPSGVSSKIYRIQLTGRLHVEGHMKTFAVDLATPPPPTPQSPILLEFW